MKGWDGVREMMEQEMYKMKGGEEGSLYTKKSMEWWEERERMAATRVVGVKRVRNGDKWHTVSVDRRRKGTAVSRGLLAGAWAVSGGLGGCRLCIYAGVSIGDEGGAASMAVVGVGAFGGALMGGCIGSDRRYSDWARDNRWTNGEKNGVQSDNFDIKGNMVGGQVRGKDGTGGESYKASTRPGQGT